MNAQRNKTISRSSGSFATNTSRTRKRNYRTGQRGKGMVPPSFRKSRAKAQGSGASTSAGGPIIRFGAPARVGQVPFSFPRVGLLPGGGSGQSGCTVEFVETILDVYPSGTGAIVPVKPAGTNVTKGTGCVHVCAQVHARFAALAQAFQRFRVSSITWEWLPLSSTATSGAIAVGVLTEYDQSTTTIPTTADQVKRLSNSQWVRPWESFSIPFRPVDQLDMESCRTIQTKYSIRFDEMQYLFIIAGEGLPTTTTVALGKLQQRTKMTFRLTE